jgi:hypothetical protein
VLPNSKKLPFASIETDASRIEDVKSDVPILIIHQTDDTELKFEEDPLLQVDGDYSSEYSEEHD